MGACLGSGHQVEVPPLRAQGRESGLFHYLAKQLPVGQRLHADDASPYQCSLVVDVRLGPQMVHDGDGDVLMKGLCSTDKFLRAILNKETGLLPPKGVLSHVGVIENPNYHKLLFLSDMAVIPLPDFRQKVKIAGYLVGVAKSFGIKTPKLAFIAASEQMLDSMPACVEAAQLAKMCDRGQIKGCIADGPLALDVAIDKESVEIKKLVSPVAGDADCLQFPNIESANVFWKTNSKLATGVRQAGMLVGTTAPCVLASRADSVDTKRNSIAEAVMFVNK